VISRPKAYLDPCEFHYLLGGIHELKRFAVYQLPFILYAGLIVLLSSMSKPPMPKFGIPNFDKYIHVVEYGVFCALAIRAIARIPLKIHRALIYLAALVVSCGFALSDEWHQSFVPGRHFDLYDLLADAIGIVLAIILFILIRNRQKRADYCSKS